MKKEELEKFTWFRVLKVLYFCVCIALLGISVLIGFTQYYSNLENSKPTRKATTELKNRQTGQVEKIDRKDVFDYIGSGKYSFVDKNQKISVLDEENNPVDISISDLPRALSQGYQYATREEIDKALRLIQKDKQKARYWGIALVFIFIAISVIILWFIARIFYYIVLGERIFETLPYWIKKIERL